jgi:hypothetical protein
MHTWIVTIKYDRRDFVKSGVILYMCDAGFKTKYVGTDSPITNGKPDACRHQVWHTDRSAMTKFVLAKGNALRKFEYEEKIGIR